MNAEDVVGVVDFDEELRLLRKRDFVLEFQELMVLRRLRDSSSLPAVLTHCALYVALYVRIRVLKYDPHCSAAARGQFFRCFVSDRSVA